MMNRHPSKHSTGFTLMELIVSIAVVSMMLFLVNRIFFDTSEAVSRGIATSKIIANTRTIGEQIEADFEKMLAPQNGGATDAGFLIITQQTINAQYLDGRDADGVVQAGRDVRSDQICFIRSRDGDTPITNTGSTNSFSGSLSVTPENYCRVWYGHVRQCTESGNPTHILGDSNTPDTYATNWILGRQLLFLDKINTGTATDFGTWNVSSRGNFNMGYSDILKKDLQNSTADGIIDDLEAITTRSGYANYLCGTGSYFIFKNGSRLAARTTPSINQLGASNIAQMHPYFVNNVSDFVVEFAGQYNGSTGIEMDGNNIKWYTLGDTLPTEINTTTGNPNDPTTPINNPYPVTNTATERTIVFFHNDDNGSSNSLWPRLLRIRYRLHDPKGELMGLKDDGTETEPGKWFEIIVKVPIN